MTESTITSLAQAPRHLFRGTLNSGAVSLPLTAAGLQASRLATCENGTFVFATGSAVYRLRCTPTRKRQRGENDKEEQIEKEEGNGVNVVASAIADDYIVPRAFSTLSVDRDAVHSTHETEIQSVAAEGVRVASVDALGRCVVTVDTSAKSETAGGRRSLVLGAVSLSDGDAGWAGVALQPGYDAAGTAVSRQMFRDLTLFDGDTAVRTFHSLLPPNATAYCGTRDILALAEGNDVVMYDARASETGGLASRKQIGSGSLLTIDVSGDGDTLVTSGFDRVVHVFDTRAMAVRDRWSGCLKYECAGALLSHDMPGMVYVCSVDNELSCGAYSAAAGKCIDTANRSQSLMISGANTKSPRRAFGFRADVRIIGMARRNNNGEEIGAITESGAFYLMRTNLE